MIKIIDKKNLKIMAYYAVGVACVAAASWAYKKYNEKPEGDEENKDGAEEADLESPAQN